MPVTIGLHYDHVRWMLSSKIGKGQKGPLDIPVKLDLPQSNDMTITA